jgi:putative oxidoreductase
MGQFFESVGLRPGRRNALAAGAAETGGGILFAAGLATPLAAAALSSVMLTALRTVFGQDGIRLGKGGYEILLLGERDRARRGGPRPPQLLRCSRMRVRGAS